MILTEIQYETGNGEFLTIAKAFQTWCHNLEDYKREVLIFIDYNNLCYFIDTKNMSSQQVLWAQKLS